MLRTLLPRLLGLGMLFAPAAFAHDTIPAQWCQDRSTTPLITGHFDFSPTSLMAFRDANPEMANDSRSGNCSNLRSCGIVDDWFWASEMSHAYCSNKPERGITSGEAMPLVLSPEEFNATAHHEHYQFDLGRLTGVCVVCVRKQVEPAPVEEEVSR